MACACGNEKKVIITACSGSANTGLMSDRVARGLRADSVGSMICLAALWADLSHYVETARGADQNLVVDGCPVSCGKKIYDKLGIPCTQILMTDFGVEKGKTDITDELISRTVSAVERSLVETGTGI